MTLPIHEQGGLTEAEIQLRIELTGDKQANTLEEKLKEHREELHRRLTTTDLALRDVGERTTALKADVAVLMASDYQQTELLKSIDKKGDAWHEDDIKFRSGLVQRVTDIEAQQMGLAKQMRILRWASGTSVAITKVAAFCLNNDTVKAVVILGMMLAIAHTVSPTIYLLVKKLLDLTK